MKMVKVYHPDINRETGSRERFSEIVEAYNVLYDEKSRNNYNKTRLSEVDKSEMLDETKKREPKQIGRYKYNPADEKFEEAEVEVTPSTYFKEVSSFYGEISQDLKNQYADNIAKFPLFIDGLTLTFHEGIVGCQKKLTFTTYEECEGCLGHACQGYTHLRKTETITVPKGVSDGSVLELNRKGNVFKEGNSAKHTNVYVKVHVKNDDRYFRREGLDIHTTNYITLSQAVLGGELKLKTLKGINRVKIPPRTQHNDTIKLSYEGVASRDKRGSHIIRVKIKLPDRLSEEHKKLLDNFKL